MKSLFILHVTLSLLTFTLVVGPAASDPICDQAEISMMNVTCHFANVSIDKSR